MPLDAEEVRRQAATWGEQEQVRPSQTQQPDPRTYRQAGDPVVRWLEAIHLELCNIRRLLEANQAEHE